MSDLLSSETRERRRGMLRTAMGPSIALALDEPDVVEVMVNPDGRLWLDRHGSGRSDTGVVLTPYEAERIILLVASHVRAEAGGSSPIVSAELPETGERFEGLLPPVALAPCFAIRKPATTTFRLSDYVKAQIASPAMARVLAEAVAEGRNILVAGGTGSGKTTLGNALLAEVAGLDQRVVIIEDTRELRCDAKDAVLLRTKPGVATLADLVRSTLRLRPDRIVVGEVRGAEALDMLKAWNTGHPGGIATVHANSARAALYRIEQLIQEAVTTVPRRLIAEAIDLVVFIKGRGPGRRIETAVQVKGLDLSGDYVLETPPGLPNPITQGTRLIGKYDSVVAFGQKRALVVWTRLILPNGNSIMIENLPATDVAGYVGLEDEVDFHTWQLLKGVALATLIGVGTQLSIGNNENDLVKALRQSVQQTTNQAGQRLVERELDVQPTITVRPGWPLRVIVSKDLVLKP